MKQHMFFRACMEVVVVSIFLILGIIFNHLFVPKKEEPFALYLYVLFFIFLFSDLYSYFAEVYLKQCVIFSNMCRANDYTFHEHTLVLFHSRAFKLYLQYSILLLHLLLTFLWKRKSCGTFISVATFLGLFTKTILKIKTR